MAGRLVRRISYTRSYQTILYQRWVPITNESHFYPQDEWYDVAGQSIINSEPSYSGKLNANEIIKLNTHREPRFYAWMAFSGGEYGPNL